MLGLPIRIRGDFWAQLNGVESRMGSERALKNNRTRGGTLEESTMSYRCHRFPREIIQHAVYLRLPRSNRSLEDIRAEGSGVMPKFRNSVRAQAAPATAATERPLAPRREQTCLLQPL